MHYENYPSTTVVADNAPAIAVYVIGAIILWLYSSIASLLYILYCILGTVAIWRFVCTHCYYYGKICPCGYGVTTAWLFRKGDETLMKNRFKYLVLLVLPSWLAPVFVGGGLLIVEFSWPIMILVVIFIIGAFIITPLVSRRLGCKHCKLQDECTWME